MSANVLRVGQNRTRRSTVTYSGPDRRGVIRKLDRPVSAETAATVMVGVITVPICVATVARALGAGLGPWSTGVADAAFVGFSIAAALLMFRWRLIGDAACVRLAATAAIIGLYFLVAATRPDTMDSGVAAALRIVSVTVIAPLTMDVLFGPEVRGDLRPVRFIVGMMAVALVGALFLGLSPARVVLQANPGGIRIVDLLAALVASVLAGMSVIEGVRRRRLLLVGLAAMLLSVGGSCTAFAVNDLGHWPSLSALFLFVGAVVFVAVVGSELQPAIDAVLIHDVRGRRRWEAAESQLTEAHSRIQVQRHDVSSMLSAIDGTLLVLTTQRDQLPAEDTDRLLVAIRDEVHVLQANLGGRPNDGRGYDLSELVETIVSVRDSGQTRLRYELEQEIEMRGRRDRVAVAVDNLLANAAIHAPQAQVTVTTRCIAHPGGHIAEITVSDDGPGLSEAGLQRAFERGWRGTSAASRPGSGIGLGQCRDLIEAEGGHVELSPSNPFAPHGHRGLTVRITLPTTSAEGMALHPCLPQPARLRVLDGGAGM